MAQVLFLNTLRELECKRHQPKCRRDRDRLTQLIDPDFREFGRSGAVYTREDMFMLLPTDTTPPAGACPGFCCAIARRGDRITYLSGRSRKISREAIPPHQPFLHLAA